MTTAELVETASDTLLKVLKHVINPITLLIKGQPLSIPGFEPFVKMISDHMTAFTSLSLLSSELPVTLKGKE